MSAAEPLDYRCLFQSAPAGYIVAGADGVIVAANDTLCGWAGVPEGALDGTRLLDLLPAGDRLMFRTHALPKLERDGHLAELSLSVLGAGGERHAVLLTVTRTRAAGQLRDLMIFFAAPERRRYERELASAHRQLEDAGAERARLLREAHHRALHDPLTGLPNRRHLQESLLEALARAGADGQRVGLLFCDVNDFKLVNDSLGHAAGDQVLEHVGRMLSGAVRGSDVVTRYSGDEFVILVPALERSSELDAVAARVRGCLAAPVTIEGTALRLGIAVGAAETAVPAAAGVDQRQDLMRLLLTDADQDMYRAKTRMRADAG